MIYPEVSRQTDSLTRQSQMPQLLPLSRLGGKAAQILQQGPARYTIAVQEALTRTAPLLRQVGSEGLWKCCEREFCLVVGVVCQCEAIMLCICEQ